MKRIAYLMLLIFSLATVQPADPASACTFPAPPPGGFAPVSTAERVENADVVIEGQVVAVDNEASPTQATILVDRYLKGSGSKRVIVNSFIDCYATVQKEQEAVFLATHAGGALYRAYYYTSPEQQTLSAVMSNDEVTVAEIIAAVGRTPFIPEEIAPEAPTEEPASTSAEPEVAAQGFLSNRPLIIGVALIAIGLVVGLFTFRRRLS